MKLFRYIDFINENVVQKNYHLPSYEEAVELCQYPESPFYETKTEVDGFPVSIFNYRLAQYSDFNTPIESKPELTGFEMRGLTFVFNQDGSLYKRYLLLDKFFNDWSPDWVLFNCVFKMVFNSPKLWINLASVPSINWRTNTSTMIAHKWKFKILFAHSK